MNIDLDIGTLVALISDKVFPEGMGFDYDPIDEEVWREGPNGRITMTFPEFIAYATDYRKPPKHEEKDIGWYMVAADSGDVEAQSELGYRYYYGKGVEKDYELAVKWFMAAAEQGDARAQCNLGVCYKFGIGIDEDCEKAIDCFFNAAIQGYELAKKYLYQCWREASDEEEFQDMCKLLGLD